MYCDKNYQSKKDLKVDLAAGKQITVFQPGGFFESKTDGRVTIEGPHYPKPHRWYASVLIKDGAIVKILS